MNTQRPPSAEFEVFLNETLVKQEQGFDVPEALVLWEQHNSLLNRLAPLCSSLIDLLGYTEGPVIENNDLGAGLLKIYFPILKNKLQKESQRLSDFSDGLPQNITFFLDQTEQLLKDIEAQKPPSPSQEFVAVWHELTALTDKIQALQTIQTHMDSVVQQVRNLQDFSDRVPGEIRQPCQKLSEVMALKADFSKAISKICQEFPSLCEAVDGDPVSGIYHSTREYVYTTIQSIKDSLVASFLHRDFNPPQIPDGVTLGIKENAFYSELLAFFSEIKAQLQMPDETYDYQAWLGRRRAIQGDLEKVISSLKKKRILDRVEKLMMAIDFLLKKSKKIGKQELRDAQKPSRSESSKSHRPKYRQSGRIFAVLDPNQYPKENGFHKIALNHGNFHFQFSNSGVSNKDLDTFMKIIRQSEPEAVFVIEEPTHKSTVGFYVSHKEKGHMAFVDMEDLITSLLDFSLTQSTPKIHAFDLESDELGDRVEVEIVKPGAFRVIPL